MRKNLHSRLVDLVAYSPLLTSVAFKALNSMFILRLPVYRFFLNRHIKAVKKRNAKFPLMVAAENTNICNARCVMCPYVTMGRRKGFMDMAIYRKVVDECAGHEGVELRLSGFGEPLLDKNLFERIVYAKEKGIEKVQLTTNASLLDDEMSRRILDSGLDEMMLSVDGYDKESYERIRAGLHFERVYENVKRFNKLRGKRARPKTIASIILFNDCIKHRKDIIKLWGDYVDRLFIKPPEDWAGEVSGYKEMVVSAGLHFPCPYIWTQFLITWDGVAALCCRDFCHIRLPIGSVVSSTIHDVWNGEKLRKFREADSRARTLAPCRGCSYTPNWWGEG